MSDSIMKIILTGLFFLLLTTSLRAQEFFIDVTATDAGERTRGVVFGYDSTASDAFVEKDFDRNGVGEQEWPDDPNFRFMMQNGALRGAYDIRHKPELDSFMIQYQIVIVSADKPIKLRWDRTRIPAAIPHIVLYSLNVPSYRRVDMTSQDTMTISAGEDAKNFEKMGVMLLYNMEPPVLAVDDVDAQGIMLYPNPYAASATLTLNLPLPSRVSVTVMDVAGRVVMQESEVLSAGNVSMPIMDQVAVAGPRFVRIVVTDSRGTRTYVRSIVKTN
jgi:hypothetical protein